MTTQTRHLVFFNYDLEAALEDCLHSGYTPLFMPQLVDYGLVLDGIESKIFWSEQFTTPSIQAIGRTKDGKELVLYVHAPHFFSDPKNLNDKNFYRRENPRNGLMTWDGVLPQEEFDRLARMGFDKVTDEKGNRLVYIVSYPEFMKASRSLILIDQAQTHPVTIAFLGGEERACQFLEKHNERSLFRIGTFYEDTLHETPLANFLMIGYSQYKYKLKSSMIGVGRFLGAKTTESRTK